MPDLRIGKAGRKAFTLPLEVATQAHGSESAALARRIWERVEIQGECWIWTGYTRNGYGTIQRSGVNLYVHRLSFELHIGAIPEGLFVCHHCDRKRCIRPSHLFAGTPADNMADMEAKGRARKVSPRGTANGKATLTDAECEAIRALVHGGVRQRDVAARFGCSQSTVWRIYHGCTRGRSAA